MTSNSSKNIPANDAKQAPAKKDEQGKNPTVSPTPSTEKSDKR